MYVKHLVMYVLASYFWKNLWDSLLHGEILVKIIYCINCSCLPTCNDQVTEQARSSIEVRMKEAEKQHRRLEEKLLEAEKGKEDSEEQKRRALASLEEQVY